MKEELSVVGKRLPQWGAQDKATGATKYTVDIKLPGMLVGKVLTSPHAHARIKKIDKSKAEKLPGVKAVITWDDVPHKLFNPSFQDTSMHFTQTQLKDQYVISEKARFVGDVIAAVAAVDEVTAEKAIELIDVDYEVLPAVFDPLEAMKPGAPVIHDSAKNNVSINYKFPVAWGDVEQGFKDADVVVEATFRTSQQHLAQLEPVACIASFDATGRLTVRAPNQRIFPARTMLAELFDIPEGMIRWINPYLGGGFGKKANTGVDPICIVLAKKTGRPVKIEYTREEDFFGMPCRETFITTGKLGVKKDGTMTALQEHLIVHSGAYFNRSSATADVSMGGFIGTYRCPNVLAEMSAVYTNIPTTGGCRGYGTPQACFILDQLIDMAAEKIGMNPLELRLKNLKQLGDPSQIGLPMETYTQEKCIKMGAEKIGWAEKRAHKRDKANKRYGVGMSTYLDVSGAQPFHIHDRNVYLKLNEDGSVNLTIGVPDLGQNILGTCAQIAAEMLGLHYEDIHIIHGDTDVCLWDCGTYANNGLYIIGQAVINACNEVKKQILERAAKKLEVPADKLDIKDKKVYVKADHNNSMTIAEIGKDAILNHEGQHQLISSKGT